MFFDREQLFAYVCVVMMFLVLGGGSGAFGWDSKEDMGFTCRDITGEIVAKDHSEGAFKLYVLLNDTGEESGFALWVGPDTYDAYQIGDVYTDRMCSLEEYEKLKEIINELIDAGILDQLS